VLVNARLKAGDVVYLMAAYNELYGWGYVNKKESYHDSELEKRSYKLTITRPVVEQNLIAASAIQRNRELGDVFGDSDVNLVELTDAQANAFNRMLRDKNVAAPPDVEQNRTEESPSFQLEFPRVPLRPGEEVWLKAVYERLREGRKPEPREMYVALLGQIPQDFEYERIDRRLIADRELTLLGILHADPATSLVEETDLVLRLIRDRIRAGGTSATSEEVSEELEIEEAHITIVFGLLRTLGQFWNGLVPHQSLPGYGSIRFEAINVVKEYLNYNGLEPLLQRLYKSGQVEQSNDSPEDDFTHSVLDWKLGERLDAGLDYIHRLTAEEVAAFDTECLTTTVEQFAIIPPYVRSDQCKRDEKTVELVDESFDRKTGQTGHCFLIPVDGEAEWLEEISAQLVASDRHPIAFVDTRRNWIYIKLSLSVDDPEGTLREKLDERVSLVGDYGSYVSKRIIDFNTELAQKMTEGLNGRKAANDKARSEIERLGIPNVANPKHIEKAIQIQRLMERLNSRYRRPLTYGEQLFEEVKELIEKNQTLDATVAKLVIEKVDDALKEFGNRNQEQKLKLREWKARAEAALPPTTFKQLKERTEGGILAKAWRRPMIRKAVAGLALLFVIASVFLYLRKAISNSEATKTAGTKSAMPVSSSGAYSGRVTDATTQEVIPRAKVSVDTLPPQTYYTDSDGMFYLKVQGSADTVRIRIESMGYETLERNVSLSRTGVEDVRLTPRSSSTNAPTQTPTQRRKKNNNEQIDRILKSRASDKPD